ncbi:MAG: hypothetical protein JST31_03810 [Actinobacteria bacterium]|nr:hypothetical protein [Actinomycetota bacterium]
MGAVVTWTEVAQVVIVGAQLAVLIAAAVVAWYQVREARHLREQQIRPFVVVDFDVESDTNVYFQVSNLGTSLARDVKIVIDPPLESAIDTDVGRLKMLNEGIATLAPGKVYRTFFDMGFRRAETDLPMNHLATVTYADETGERPFRETVNLDLDQYMNMKFIQKRGIHDVHRQLESIGKIFEKWGWGNGQGLIAMTPEEARRENNRIMEEMRERQRQRESTED